MMFAGLEEIITEHEPLAQHTWFNLGGPARWMARPRSVDQVAAIVRRCGQEEVPLYRLGQGANLLIDDAGVDGVVVHLTSPAFRSVAWGEGDSSDTVFVRVGGGADMARLARESVNRGLAGIECMAGIPGSLGGIVRMNAGGKFGQISDSVVDVTVVDEAGTLKTLTHDEVGFRYRHTNLKNVTVCGATLRLRRDDARRLRERFLEIFEYKKHSQPLADHSAGCVFKNPQGHSAGALIDRAGLKGRAVGGAYVSTAHANFIGAKEGASARDVMTLVGIIRREVADRFGVELELEIEVWEASRSRRTEAAA